MIKTKLYKKTKGLFAPLVVLLLLFALFRLLNESILTFEDVQVYFSEFPVSTIVFVFILAIVNWLLETRKWWKLVNIIEHTSFVQSLRSVLTGLSLGLITPNRIGEYGGRLLELRAENKKKGLALSAVGSFYQLLVTLIIGTASIYPLSRYYHFQLPIDVDFSKKTIIYTTCVISVILLVSLLFRHKLKYYLGKLKKGLLKTLHKTSHLKVELFILSLLRYIAFSLQFCLLLMAFEIGLEFQLCFLLVAVTYFVNTVSPGGMLLNLGWRTGTTVFIFSLAGGDPIATTFSTLTLWLVNLFLPGLIGIIWFRKPRAHSFSIG